MRIDLKFRTKLKRCPKCGCASLEVVGGYLSFWQFGRGRSAGKRPLWLFGRGGAVFRCSNDDKCDAKFGFRGGWLVCLNKDG